MDNARVNILRNSAPVCTKHSEAEHMLKLVNLWSEEHAADIRSLIAGGELQVDTETYMYALGKEVVYHQLSDFIDVILRMLAKRNENN